jgi:hypothetical protein
MSIFSTQIVDTLPADIVRRGDLPYIRPESNSQASLENALARANAQWLARGIQTEVYAGNGDFTLLNLAVPSGVRLIFGDRAVIQKDPSGGVGSHHVRMYGSVGTTSALTSDVAARGSVIPVTDGAAFSVGDVAMIREQTFVISSVGQKLEIFRVLAVNGNNVTVDRPLLESYSTAASAELALVSAVDQSVIEGGRFVNLVGNLKGGCIDVNYAIDCAVKGVRGELPADMAVVQTMRSCRLRLSDLYAADGQNMLAGGYGYAFIVAGSCHDITVERTTQRNVRESSVSERARAIEWSHHDSCNSKDSSIGTHGSGCRGVTFSHIRSVADASGLVMAGLGEADYQVRFEYAEVIRPAGNAISLATSNPAKKHSDVVFKHFRVFEPQNAAPAVSVANCDKADLDDGVIDSAGGAASDGVQYYGSVLGRLNDVKVLNLSNGYGVTLSDTYDCCVTRCLVDNVSSTHYRGLNSGSAANRNFFENNHSTMASGWATMGTGYTARNNSWQ